MDMIYRYQDIASHLARLAYIWRQKVRVIEHPLGLQNWGPSAAAIAEANVHELTAQVEPIPDQDGSDNDDDDEGSDSSAEQDTDEELYDHMEALVLNEHYEESKNYIIADVDMSSKRRRLD